MTSCSHGAGDAARGDGAIYDQGRGPETKRARRCVCVDGCKEGLTLWVGETDQMSKGWRMRRRGWEREGGAGWGWGKQERGGWEGWGAKAAGTWGEDEDQPFSFTAGDPGSLRGGITCETRHGKKREVTDKYRASPDWAKV